MSRWTVAHLGRCTRDYRVITAVTFDDPQVNIITSSRTPGVHLASAGQPTATDFQVDEHGQVTCEVTGLDDYTPSLWSLTPGLTDTTAAAVDGVMVMTGTIGYLMLGPAADWPWDDDADDTWPPPTTEPQPEPEPEPVPPERNDMDVIADELDACLIRVPHDLSRLDLDELQAIKARLLADGITMPLPAEYLSSASVNVSGMPERGLRMRVVGFRQPPLPKLTAWLSGLRYAAAAVRDANATRDEHLDLIRRLVDNDVKIARTAFREAIEMIYAVDHPEGW
jgi:hypothetical protein